MPAFEHGKELSLFAVDACSVSKIFEQNGSLAVISHIKDKVKDFVPDVMTERGRKEIASLAYKVARSKTAIDDAGKQLVSEIKAKALVIDAERKKIRDELDAIKDDIRKPLTLWEEEQEAIQAAKELAEKVDKDHSEAIELNLLFNRQKEIAAREAELAKMEAERKAAIEREERERRIAEESAEKERRAAEQKIIDARLAQERAEREKTEAIDRERLAKERAEIEKREAAERERMLLERAEQEKKEAIERERMEVARVEAARKAEEESRAKDKEHRRKINNEALTSLVSAGIPANHAEMVIKMIVCGHVPHVSIKY